ncbi:MAG: flagella basal body P-ring formation protein FlgA [Rickettsiales bacterium]|nr:MAG: flagella basal body P-ring formation protein FlgA [Rickettsiales bacterium]
MKLYKHALQLLLLQILLVLIASPAFSFGRDDFVAQTIYDLLQEKSQDKRIIFEPKYSSGKKMDAIKTHLEDIKTITLGKFEPSRSSFRAIIHYNNGKSDVLSGRYESYILVPVAARYIKFGSVIQSIDFTTKKTRLVSLAQGYATEESEIIGMQSKKYINIGHMFELRELARPLVIKTNDPVNITYSVSSIHLKTVGVAMGSGSVGDMLRVKNTSSGAILLGQIINKNTVQIGGNNE